MALLVRMAVFVVLKWMIWVCNAVRHHNVFGDKSYIYCVTLVLVFVVLKWMVVLCVLYMLLMLAHIVMIWVCNAVRHHNAVDDNVDTYCEIGVLVLM